VVSLTETMRCFLTNIIDRVTRLVGRRQAVYHQLLLSHRPNLNNLQTFEDTVICAAGKLLVAWHSPTILLPPGVSIENDGSANLTTNHNPDPELAILWDELAIELSGLAAKWLIFQEGGKCSLIEMTRIRSRAEAIQKLDPSIISPWTDESPVGLPAESGNDSNPRTNETVNKLMNIGWRRAAIILTAHHRKLEKLCNQLAICGEVDQLEAWEILGPRPILFPLLNLAASVERTISTRLSY